MVFTLVDVDDDSAFTEDPAKVPIHCPFMKPILTLYRFLALRPRKGLHSMRQDSESRVPMQKLTIDATTFKIIGYASAHSTGGLAGFLGTPQAANSTGLVFEIADHGVAINDATSVHDFTNASPIGGFFTVAPAEGPLNAATERNSTPFLRAFLRSSSEFSKARFPVRPVPLHFLLPLHRQVCRVP